MLALLEALPQLVLVRATMLVVPLLTLAQTLALVLVAGAPAPPGPPVLPAPPLPATGVSWAAARPPALAARAAAPTALMTAFLVFTICLLAYSSAARPADRVGRVGAD